MRSDALIFGEEARTGQGSIADTVGCPEAARETAADQRQYRAKSVRALAFTITSAFPPILDRQIYRLIVRLSRSGDRDRPRVSSSLLSGSTPVSRAHDWYSLNHYSVIVDSNRTPSCRPRARAGHWIPVDGPDGPRSRFELGLNIKIRWARGVCLPVRRYSGSNPSADGSLTFGNPMPS
jgi:hypothetical protein